MSAPRCAPPPPSNPPPRNISRSGRVPPPKGAPPGRARRAGQSDRRTLKPETLEPKGDRVGVRQRGDDQGFSRHVNIGKSTPSNKESFSDNSSQGSFEESLSSSDHGRGLHPLPAVRRRQRRRSRGGKNGSPRDRTEESLEDRRSSRVERRGRRNQSRQSSAGRDGQPSRSASWSSDYDVSYAKADRDREETETEDNLRQQERDEGRDRNSSRQSPRRGVRGTPRSNGSNRRQSDTTSDTGSEEDNENWRPVKRKSHRQCLKQQQQHTMSTPRTKAEDRAARDRVGPNGMSTFCSGSVPEELRRSDVLEDVDSQYCTLSCGRSPEGPRSQSEESCTGNRNRYHRRKRAEQDDSEAEGYGWDSADVSSSGGLSKHQELSRLAPNGEDHNVERKPNSPSWETETKSNNYGGHVADSAGSDSNATVGTPQRLANRNRKNVDDLGVWGSDREEHDGPQYEETAEVSSSGHKLTQSPVAQDEESPHATAGSRAAIVAGKPIRGARWGESIGVRSRIFDTSTIPTKRGDLKEFVSCPLQSGPGTVLRCFIERDRSGTHTFSHVFSMYADLGDGNGRMLLAARKLLASKTAYYIICVRQEDLFRDSGKRGGSSFLAKLRASGAGHTEYALYDRGDNPAVAAADFSVDSGADAKPKSKRNALELARSKTLMHQEKHEQGEIRRELGVIVYNFDKKEQRTGKRRMEVAIPQLRQEEDSWEPVSWQPVDTKESMINNFGRIRYQGAQNFLQDDRLLIYHQRESRYDPLSSCLVDYRGRATAPSVKNFQLLKSPPEDNVKRARYYSEGAGKGDIESDDIPRPVYLQMGKVGKDCFNVDLEWPLSVLQGFAICLSRFDAQAQF